MNDELITRLYQDAYNEILIPFLTVKNGSPILQYQTTDGIEGKIRKKFAELIVRECAEIALRESHEPYECILKHFEIED